MKNKQLTNIFILYDSITNAVFASQVLAPLIKQQQHWHIISFEKADVTPPQHDCITFHIFKRTTYLSHWSLRSAIRQVKNILQQYDCYRIVARGPFAGYITLQAADNNCQKITIQSRGLVAQEYAYTHKNSYNLIHYLRTKLFGYLEHRVYSTRNPLVTIEVVSPALRTYLITHFNADPKKITIAQDDIPSPLTEGARLRYRTLLRAKLRIPDSTTIYCYNGSYKAWQCPHETIAYSKQLLVTDTNAFLLILTADQTSFAHLVDAAQLSRDRYHICTVTQDTLYHYLAAADYGILFREPHIMNHISRPTKALEYHAAGLCIIHNDSVDYIKHMRHLKQHIISLNGYRGLLRST